MLQRINGHQFGGADEVNFGETVLRARVEVHLQPVATAALQPIGDVRSRRPAIPGRLVPAILPGFTGNRPGSGNAGFESGQGRRREAGAAGKGFAFHAFFESAHMQAVGSLCHEIHVGSFRLEGRVPAERLGIGLHVQGCHIGHKLDEVPGAGVQKVAVLHRHNPVNINHFQPNRPFFSGNLLRQNLRSVFAVGGEETVDGTIGRTDAEVIGKCHDASTAVAAHHAAGPVGIVEFHHEIRRSGPVGDGAGQNHEPVRMVRAAQCADSVRLPEGVHAPPSAIQHDKIVPRSGELKNPWHVTFCHLISYV